MRSLNNRGVFYLKRYFLFLLLIALFFLASCNQHDTYQETDSTHKVEIPPTITDTKTPEYTPLNYDFMKAIWLSQFDMSPIYTKDGQQRDETEYAFLIDKTITALKGLGFNTVIIQARPNCDSVYPSDIFPPSKYAVGQYGNVFKYDPLEMFIEKAHENDLSVQIWINPYRCTSTADAALIDSKYPVYNAIKNKEKYIKQFNGYYYLDPLYEESKTVILGGIKEILAKYDADGIHIDDYFYPTADESFDLEEYAANKEISLADFRRNNVTDLIKRIYDTVKEKDQRLIFGVSPAGNIENTFARSFADVYKWCSNEGYIDYISPQIYFGMKHQTHPFDKTFDVWKNIVKNKKVKLITGITLEKAYTKTDKWAGNGSDEWAKNNDVIKSCVSYALSSKNCFGFSFFSLQFIYDPITDTRCKETYNEIDNFSFIINRINANKIS